MSATALIARYAGFAVLAVLVNLATQRLVLGIAAAADGAALAAAIAAGTLTGLVVKYLLDKRWIFMDREAGLAAHGRKFTLYTAMGLLTTAIFWGSETLFWLLWRSDAMRELGAVLGLTVGYVTKYRLDRRFVFVPAGKARQARGRGPERTQERVPERGPEVTPERAVQGTPGTAPPGKAARGGR
ncbi:MAG: hypothetical protein Kow0058_10780 [Roseovarius sp.]